MNVAVAALDGNGEEIAALLRLLNQEKLFIITTQEGVEELNRICRDAKWHATSETLRVFVVKDPNAGHMEFYGLAQAWMDELLALPNNATIYICAKPSPSTPPATPPLKYLLNSLGSNLMASRANTRVVEVVTADATAEPRIVQHYPPLKVCRRCGGTFEVKMMLSACVADTQAHRGGREDLCPRCLSV